MQAPSRGCGRRGDDIAAVGEEESKGEEVGVKRGAVARGSWFLGCWRQGRGHLRHQRESAALKSGAP